VTSLPVIDPLIVPWPSPCRLLLLLLPPARRCGRSCCPSSCCCCCCCWVVGRLAITAWELLLLLLWILSLLLLLLLLVISGWTIWVTCSRCPILLPLGSIPALGPIPWWPQLARHPTRPCFIPCP
jgi:hypothetical protein